MEYKRKMISPFALFAMLFVSRVLVVFTLSNVTYRGDYASDMLISLAIGLAGALVLSVPVAYAAKKKHRLTEPPWLSALYGVYFLYLGAVSIGRFSFFASMELNTKSQALFHAVLIILACTYAVWLGIEPISRFGAFIFVVTLLGIICIVAFGVENFSILNLFPFTQNSSNDIISNGINFACQTVEIIMLAVLAPKVNGKVTKPFYSAILLSFAVCGILFFYSVGVFGDTAKVVSFPFYDLSQISTLENARLDSVYTAFWIFAVFLKGALFLYCACECFNIKKKGLRCVLPAIGMLAIVWLLSQLDFFLYNQMAATVIPFLLFGFAVPIANLLFRKKSKGEILLEKL